jgi:DNA-binding protein HU-beta
VPNKAQFIDLLATRMGVDRKTATTALDAVLDTIYAEVSKGQRVVLTGFGIFEKRDRAARKARNPATGESVRVKKTSVPAFRAGAQFKAVTSGARKVAKVPAKKAAAAKTAPAKKAAATKAPAKKAPAKKTAAKKAPAKKASR